MMKKIGMLCIIALVLMVPAIALSGAGPGGTGCDPAGLAALPKTGQTLQGSFTVARTATAVGAPQGEPAAEYQVHYVLTKGSVTHEFTFSWIVDGGPYAAPLCGYTAADLLENLIAIPCYQSVGETFGSFATVPVLESVYVASEEGCDDPWNERISGYLTVRLAK
jgi:hypothetical protein